VGTYPVGSDPGAITFDGTHIWVANQIDNTVTEIDDPQS
jgi:DNA-binding beta-propeller fold protein YncE